MVEINWANHDNQEVCHPDLVHVLLRRALSSRSMDMSSWCNNGFIAMNYDLEICWDWLWMFSYNMQIIWDLLISSIDPSNIILQSQNLSSYLPTIYLSISFISCHICHSPYLLSNSVFLDIYQKKIMLYKSKKCDWKNSQKYFFSVSMHVENIMSGRHNFYIFKKS